MCHEGMLSVIGKSSYSQSTIVSPLIVPRKLKVLGVDGCIVTARRGGGEEERRRLSAKRCL